MTREEKMEYTGRDADGARCARGEMRAAEIRAGRNRERWGRRGRCVANSVRTESAQDSNGENRTGGRGQPGREAGATPQQRRPQCRSHAGRIAAASGRNALPRRRVVAEMDRLP